MLFAILFDDSENVVAVAPACDQQPYANRYWTEIYPIPLSVHAGYQTAYFEVNDISLVDRLQHLPLDPTLLPTCTDELERILRGPDGVSIEKQAA